MDPKKKGSLLIALLGHKAKGGSDEEMPDKSESDSQSGDENAQLGSQVMEAVKGDDPSAVYDAICAVIEHHMDQDEEPESGKSLLSSSKEY